LPIDCPRRAPAWAGPAELDERRLMPAWHRFDGSHSKAAQSALSRMTQGARTSHVVIVSGAYGLLLAEEPIGTYDARFNARDRPQGLLEEVLAEYACCLGVRAVRAFASSTTDCVRVIRRVSWASAGVCDAWLFAPAAAPGAMVLSPRAQGEALDALIGRTLRPEWKSSDGLALQAARLEPPSIGV
jgi:hypothetical protein